LYAWGNNEFGELGVPVVKSHLPLKVLANVKKVSAASHFSAALTNEGEVYVWGRNHYKQLGVKQEVLDTPTLICSEATDIETGEGSLMILKENDLYICGLNEYEELTKVETSGVPVGLACGDEWAAYISSSGLVYSLGGLFREDIERSYFFEYRGKEFKQNSVGFFEGRVLSIVGKYSYYTSILA